MSLSVSASRTSNLVVQFKKLLARICLAFDESQRRRAAALIHRYRHLIPDYDEKSNNEEGGRSLLEFRDPLSLMPKTETLGENREVSQLQCVPLQVEKGGTD